MQNYSALDSCFISSKSIASLVNNHEIKFSTYLPGTGTSRSLKIESIAIQKIFNTNKENEIIFVTGSTVAKYDTNLRKTVGQETMDEETVVRSIVFGNDGKVAVVGKYMIMITNENL